MAKNIYKKVYDLLLSGQKIVLAKTIRRSGSTPRDVGSMCIITQQEELIGTVGGGVLEHKVQNRAKKVFEQEESFIYQFELSNEDLAKNGMICGGNVDLYLEPLFPENVTTLPLFKTINQHIISNRPGILVTRIKTGIHAMQTDARIFITRDGNSAGTISGLDPEKISVNTDKPYDLISFDGWNDKFFVEKISPAPKIFLFGAGHVSMFVAHLAKMVGFDITLIDDRKEFANKERFPGADKIVVTDFKHAFEKPEIFQNSYILIITRGHLYDKLVLEHALGTSASYIGMIGSMKKRNTIYKALMEQGVPKEELEKVYSPVGIDINAQTPEEIAVSIVGELIQKRAPEKKTKNLIV